MAIVINGVADLLRPGLRVFIPGAANEPLGLLESLAENPEKAAGVTFVQFPLPGWNQVDFCSFHPQARMEIFFLSPHLRSAFQSGQARFCPLGMRRIYDHLASGPPFDIALLQAGESQQGVLRHGPNVDFIEAVLGNCRKIALEWNHAMNPPLGAPAIELGLADYVMETQRPIKSPPAPANNPAAEAIGAQISALIPDGACLQTGIGSIPAAALGSLREHNDLGLHGGLIDPALLTLIERGVINGSRKQIEKGQHIACMALGDEAFYNALAAMPEVVLCPARHTHQPAIISSQRDFVSINSALQVDLLGQIGAEMLSGRQISGPGGAVDFMRGAAGSPGGMSIIALGASARDGSKSRIVPCLGNGDALTATRTDSDIVVTEHGMARLRGLSVDQRAAALIAIAAPQFRDELESAWKQMRARM